MKEKKPNKILNAILTVLLIASTALVLIGIYQKITNKNVIPYKVCWVMTDSMEETIPERSYILTKSVDPSTLKEGDIITFVSSDPDIEGMLNTHRIVRILGDNEYFITKGDNNPVEDQYSVSADKIDSVYVCNLPLFTFFGRFFATKYGLATVLISITAVFVIWERTSRKKMKQESKQEAINEAIKKEVERLEKEAKEK